MLCITRCDPVSLRGYVGGVERLCEDIRDRLNPHLAASLVKAWMGFQMPRDLGLRGIAPGCETF
nr:hypothetical protein [uncultured Erythrobacter sp.]